MSHKEFFTEIYDSNHWGIGSGIGSQPENTLTYRKFLQRFIKDYEVKSVLDAGCGLWESTQLLEFTDIVYLGVDVVDSVIKENKRKFEKENIRFLCCDLRDFKEKDFDLLIIKDVLIHWTNAEIITYLPELKRFKHVLIINDRADRNEERSQSKWRPVNIWAAPFYLTGCILLSYHAGPTVKTVFSVKH